jgi:uncharacterized protein (TIGR03435 family)
MGRIAVVLVALICTPILIAQEATRKFEVASIKPSAPDSRGMVISGPAPSQFTTKNVPLERIILYAYGRRAYHLTGGPDWIRSERFDIVAKYPSVYAPAEVSAMVRGLLEERFRLNTHVETREGPIYLLVLAREDRRLGPSLRKTPVDCEAYRAELAKSGETRAIKSGDPCVGLQVGDGLDRLIWASGMTMTQIAQMLALAADRDVVDQSGLTGDFDARLRWRPDITPSPSADAAQTSAVSNEAVSLFTAIQEQLGLKLESSRGPVEFLVIDSVERPTPD